MRVAQQALLRLYGAIRRTGLLATAPGRLLFEHGYWAYKALLEARDIDQLRPYAAPGSTVVDVGANIGFFTVRFASWVGARGSVIAIEPEQVNFRSLCARVNRLKITDNVVPVQAAAVERSGEVRLELNPDHPADHRVAAVGVPVPAVSIDDLIGQRGWPVVSLIKIDVQGSELQVIRGASETLRRFMPALYVEFHELSLLEAGTSSSELLGEVTTLGYAPAFLNPEGAWQRISPAQLAIEMKARGYLDVLLLRADAPLTH